MFSFFASIVLSTHERWLFYDTISIVLLDIFKADPEFLANEEKYKEIKTELMGSDSDDSDGSGDGSGSDADSDSDDG